MKDWEISAPYLLPRILSFKRWRSNTLPTKLPKPHARTPTAIPLENGSTTRRSVWRRSDYFYPEMIPEPDYSDSDENEEEEEDEEEEEEEEEGEEVEERLRGVEEKSENEDDKMRLPIGRDTKELEQTTRRLKELYFQDDGLVIKPKKPNNPYLHSSERQKLHKELKFNQKYGNSNGNRRTELQVALERYTENKFRKDFAASRRSSLEKILEQQARKIEQHEKEGTSDVRPAWIEALQKQHMTRSTDPKTDEFYRVHAKVVHNFDRISNRVDSRSASDLSSKGSSSSSEVSD